MESAALLFAEAIISKGRRGESDVADHPLRPHTIQNPEVRIVFTACRASTHTATKIEAATSEFTFFFLNRNSTLCFAVPTPLWVTDEC